VNDYLPILLMIGLVIAFAGLSFVASSLLGPSSPNSAKQAPYECGIVPEVEPAERFPVKFYLVAMAFIVLDVEIVFLYPFAVVFRQLGLFGLVAMGAFVFGLLIPFAYLLSVGALAWGPVQRRLAAGITPVRRAASAMFDPAAARAAEPVEHEEIPHNVVTGRLEDLVKWARRNSVFPATFGLACCALEMMASGAAHYDLARYGMEVFRASPRQADLMIVAGRVSNKMAPVLRQVYDQMVDPKWVISMGVCASSGGMFNNYAIVQGVDQIVPVDVYVPGCPPGPETLMHGIVTLHEMIRSGELLKRRATTVHGGAGVTLEPASA
jgi:NADH-quinone oxidoreductase subunit B